MTRRRDGGFTLLEVMAAMMILLAGVVGIIGLFASGLAMHRNATQNSTVAQASEDVRVRVRDYVESAIAENAELMELAPLEKVPIEGYPRYFYDATFVSDDELGPAAGVMSTVRVYTVDVGREKGHSFTVFARPTASPEAWIRGAKNK